MLIRRFAVKPLPVAIIVLLGLILFGCRAGAGPAPGVTPTVGNSEATISATQLPAVGKPAEAATQKPTNTPLPVPTQGPYLPALPVWGVELYHLGGDQLAMVKDAGGYWVRRNALMWSDVEPAQGTYNWDALSGLENELKAAAEQGLQVMLVVRSTPAWAQTFSGSFCSAPKPESLEAFGDFLVEAVQRYSVPPYNVQYWEIGNEPDVAPEALPSEAPFGCWGVAGDPYFGGQYYADILKAVYPKIKAANPQAQVLVGGLLLDCDPINPPETSPGSGDYKDCSSAQYLEGILKNSGAGAFDGISFHAYDYYGGGLGKYANLNWNSTWKTTGPSLTAKADYIRGLLNLYGVSGKYLVNTESALICGNDGSEPDCQSDEFQRTKAYYAAQAFVAAIAEKLTANVWYSLTGWRASGLVDQGIQPLPVYKAFRNSAALLTGAGYIGPINDYPEIQGYAFEKDDAPLWVLWALDEGENSIELDQPPKSITDVFGDPLDPSQEVTVTTAPIYIEFEK